LLDRHAVVRRIVNGQQWEHQAMSLLGATIVTAIATLALAVLAIATAIFAGLAFWRQSQEVRAIERQVADGHELTEQQSKLINIQNEQLSEQRQINKLQADDLRESVRERARLRQVAERAQADQISFEMTSTPFPRIPEEEGYGPFAVEPGDPVHTAIVTNGSHRPISKVVCRIGGAPDADDLFPQEAGRESNLAVLVGRLPVSETVDGRSSGEIIHPGEPRRDMRIRPGEIRGFVFEINAHRVLGFEPLVAVRFTDDGGLHWQIDIDQHLQQIPDRDW
jgi:cell division protein FtsB